ncbi:precorrin-6y C5,15-methyltransferase (decarboxylating) subunit CbiE [Oceanidesulfovibrio marinus]|nr:precorrin-6y C5,15-methyltransferase (decarboxylating) subunit CbiE [Oceanidesulfovibrio marinus]
MALYVVGLGMDPGTLPEEHEERIYLAQVLVGGERQLAWYDDHPAEKIVVKAPVDPILDTIAERLKEGKEVVVVASGDPLYFGIADTLVRRFGQGEVDILPNISSLQAAAARIKIPWQEVVSVSLHGRENMGELLSMLMLHDRVAVLTDRRNIPSAIAQTLLERAVDEDAPHKQPFMLWVFEDMESDRERVTRYTLDEAAQTSFSRLNMVLVERTMPPPDELRIGIPDEEFSCESRVITKWPVRAVGLAGLGPVPGDVIWDLGAGCGAVSIEAAAIIRRGRIVAVERRGGRVADIRRNVARFGALIVEPVHGTVPECLDELPDPDKIFIGGGLSTTSEMLEHSAARLSPGGRLVIHCVLLDTLALTKAFLKQNNWPHEVTLIHPSQSRELAGDMHFKAYNPVFIISANKPE